MSRRVTTPGIGDIFGGYELVEPLGEGSYGRVYRARREKDGKEYALKCIKMDSFTQGIPPTTLREIATLRSLGHPNIVKFVLYFCLFLLPSNNCFFFFTGCMA